METKITFFQSLKGLVFGGRQIFSLGRVSFWMCFGVAMYQWIKGTDIQPGQMFFLLTILGYCSYGKSVGAKYYGPGKPIEIVNTNDTNNSN
jgi:hypothetical protein